MSTGNDPYAVADPILLPWAHARGLRVDTRWKDIVVRSIWVPDVPNREQSGQAAQLWLEWWPKRPGRADVIEVHVAVGTWHHQIDANLATLAHTLDGELDLLLSKA